MNRIILEGTSKYNYKEVKDIIDNIDIKSSMNTPEYEQLISILKTDKRKNINSLGERLIKAKDKLSCEIQRIKNMYNFDKSYGYNMVAGVDEVGRGPLAGPIVACAVMLDLDVLDDELILELNDSKKLSKKKREELASIIKEKALCYKIAECTNDEIDKRGISYCNNKVFLDSVNNLDITPELVLSDGYLVKNITIDNQAVIKGDTKSACIAAASIVAKVYRDNLMEEYAKKYPYYDFEENAGYGTSKHIEGIKQHGICSIHRKCFLTKIMDK